MASASHLGTPPEVINDFERASRREDAIAARMRLLGSLDYTWESSSPEVLEVTSDLDSATLSPVASGVATVTVRQGGVERSVEVVVHP